MLITVAGSRPPRRMKTARGERVDAHHRRAAQQPAERHQIPGHPPGTGMTRTAVVLLLMMPMASSSAMIALMVSSGVSPGMANMSSPTEQTAVSASSLSRLKRALLNRIDHARVLADRDKGAA